MHLASIDQALNEYQTLRFPRVFQAQQAAWQLNGVAQRSNWFRRVVRSTTMFFTHNSTALTRTEKKFMGGKELTK